MYGHKVCHSSSLTGSLTLLTFTSPYKFGSSWNAFELASHALEVKADVLIVSMSWVTSQDSRDFSRTLAEPDMETLTYWVQRLEPLIAAELDREIIVIFCNRCGQEAESLYAGTSAVVGIKGGEVSVYALAGRGTKEFLMADTSRPAFAKLVQTPSTPSESEGSIRSVSIVAATDIVGSAKWPSPPPSINPMANSPTVSNFSTSNSIAPRRTGPLDGRPDRSFPKLQIPAQLSQIYTAWSPSMGGSPITIPTPEAPSPTPLAIRPKLMIPEGAMAALGDFRKVSPFPHDSFVSEQHRFFGRQSQPFTPVMSPEEIAQATIQYFWKPSDTLLNMPINIDWASSPRSPNGRDLNPFVPLTPYPGANTNTQHMWSVSLTSSTNPPKILEGHVTMQRTPPDRSNSDSSAESGMTTKGGNVDPLFRKESSHVSGRQSPPKPRSGSRSAKKSRVPLEVRKQDSNLVGEQLQDSPAGKAASTTRRRPSLLEDARHLPTRSDSPKTRLTSGSRDLRGVRERSTSNVAGAFNKSTRDTTESPAGSTRTRSASTVRRSSSRARNQIQDTSSSSRPPSRAQANRKEGDTTRSRSNSIARYAGNKKVNDAVDIIRPRPIIRAHTPRTSLDESRPVSRGRQRVSREGPPPAAEKDISPPQTEPRQTSVPRHVSITRIQSASRLGQVRYATPDDDIVAIEEYFDPTCQSHHQRAASTSAVATRIPSIEDGRAIVGMKANLPPPPPMFLPSQAYQPTETTEVTSYGITEFRTPSVLGGTVKTTILDAVHVRTESGVSVLSPAFSVTSVTSTTSVSTHPTSNSTPSHTPRFDMTPRGSLAIAHLMSSKRVDTPIPALACNHCGHIGQFHPMNPEMKQLLGPDTRAERRSW